MIKNFIFVVVAVMAVGCAQYTDVDNLQAQISELKIQVEEVSANAASAKMSAENALKQATSAEQAAISAAELSQATSDKLDRMFKKSK